MTLAKNTRKGTLLLCKIQIVQRAEPRIDPLGHGTRKGPLKWVEVGGGVS